MIRSKDQQIIALRNQLSSYESNPFGLPEFREKYDALVQETNAYREQNQALNAEILNLRGLFSASVDHERQLIDAVKRLHEIYSMVRPIPPLFSDLPVVLGGSSCTVAISIRKSNSHR